LTDFLYARPLSYISSVAPMKNHNNVYMLDNLLLTSLLPLFSTVFSLSSKELLKYIGPDSYTGFALLGAGILSLLYNFHTGTKTKFNRFSVISGLSFGAATLLFEQALKRAGNPGLANAMYRSQAALTALVSVVVLGSSLSLLSLFGVCATVAGAALVAKDHEDKREDKKEGFEALRNEDRPKAMSKGDRKVQKAFDKSWIAMALTAGVLLTVKDITAVLALRGNKMTPSSYVVSQCLFGTLIVFAYKFATEGTLRPKLSADANVLDLVAGLGLVSLDNFLWCAVLVYLMSVARNPAFPKAVTMSGVALTAFLSSFLFKGASLDRDQWSGIALILGGVGAVILG